MTVSICAEIKHSTDNRPYTANISREIAEAFVEAIVNHEAFNGLSFIKDFQLGSLVDEAPPAIVESLLSDLPELPEEAQLVFERALAENRGLNIRTNDDVAYGQAPQATISLHYNALNEPCLEWTASHAAHAFKALGLEFQDGIMIQASELKNLCEKSLRTGFQHDTHQILKVANYALRTQGNEAKVQGY